MRIVSVVGARPQYIKLAPLHRELTDHKLEHLVINTGQHYDHNLSAVFFGELALPKPAVDLKVGSAAAAVMVARILELSARALRRLAPDLVVVYGDTNSTLGGALAAVQLGIPIAHVEAGLRCFDLAVPEEVNRVLTDHVSAMHFCPTTQSKRNLASEGIKQRVHLTGDILYDVLNSAMPSRSEIGKYLQDLGLEPQSYLLLTCHRAGTVDNRESLARLVKLLERVKESVIFPLHPHTKKRLAQYGLMRQLRSNANVRIIPPCGYRESLALIASARRVLTDSGGVQREAYRLKVPSLIIRDVTEWVEILKARGGMLVGFDASKWAEGLNRRRFSFRDRAVCRAGAASRMAQLLAGFA